MWKAACLDRVAGWWGEKEPGITGSSEPGSRGAGSSQFLVHLVFIAKMVKAWILKVGVTLGCV